MKRFATGLFLTSLAVFGQDVKPMQTLTVEDQETISRSVIGLLNARVLMLEALVADKMGIKQQKDYDTARETLTATTTSIKRKYKAPETCDINLITKEWVCSTPLAAPEKK